MLRRHCRRRQLTGLAHKVNAFCRCHMLEDNPQAGKLAADIIEVTIDKDFFTVKNINVCIGDFTVNQQRHIVFFHGRVEMGDLARIGDATVGVSGSTGRVQLEGMHEVTLRGPRHLFHRGGIGQVQHHQRLEGDARRHLSQNSLPVLVGLGHRIHRRGQVGHDNGTAKHVRRGRHRLGEQSAVAEMQMPVVRAGDGQGVSHGVTLGRSFSGYIV